MISQGVEIEKIKKICWFKKIFWVFKVEVLFVNFQVNMEIYRELKIGGSDTWSVEGVKRPHLTRLVIIHHQGILRDD